jgi:hypothetical protein
MSSSFPGVALIEVTPPRRRSCDVTKYLSCCNKMTFRRLPTCRPRAAGAGQTDRCDRIGRRTGAIGTGRLGSTVMNRHTEDAQL